MSGAQKWDAFDWTEEAVDTLKKMVRDCMSAGQAAAKLGCSRSAAIGKARRLGISFRSAPPPSMKKGKPAHPGNIRRKREARRKDPGLPSEPKRPEPKPASPAPQAAVEVLRPEPDDFRPKMIRFIDVEQGQCKWPYGDPADGPEMKVCGCATRLGAAAARGDDFGEGYGLTWKRRVAPLAISFCPHHLRMAGVGIPASERFDA